MRQCLLELLRELLAAVEKSNIVTGGGFLLSKSHESLIRIVGRATTLDEVADTVVRAGNPVPITIREVADVLGEMDRLVHRFRKTEAGNRFADTWKATRIIRDLGEAAAQPPAPPKA